jgi:hypothetical protein
MRIADRNTIKLTCVSALVALTALLACTPGASADTGSWRLEALSDTTVAPGGRISYLVAAINPSPSATDGTEIDLTAELPAGATALEATIYDGENFGNFAPCAVENSTEVKCTTNWVIPGFGIYTGRYYEQVFITATAPAAEGKTLASFAVEGGGKASATAVDAVEVTDEAPRFGISGADAQSLQANGQPSTQAAAHPDLSVASVRYNLGTDPLEGPRFPVEPTKGVFFELPPGQLGNPATLGTCTASQLANAEFITPRPLCPPESQVGTATVTLKLDYDGGGGFTTPSDFYVPLPLFNMVPPSGVPARFGFAILGELITVDAAIRNGSDYGATLGTTNAPQAIALLGSTVEVWGVPASPVHDPERACPGELPPAFGAPSCKSQAPPAPLLRNPTSCAGPLTTTVRADSWFHPGAFDSVSPESHELPGFPRDPEEWGAPQGIEECAKVRFRPQIEASPTTNVADAPSGLDFHLRVPQDCWEHVEEVCQSDLKEAEVKLPQGMTLNPSAANGLGSCSEAQIGYLEGTSEPFEFDAEPAGCPDNSKIGRVTIETPLLAKPLTGAVYLAKQDENPFGSLLGLYITAEGSGLRVKQAGEIEMGPGGRMTTRFENAPQTPFSDLHLELFGGSRAPLRTPPACGSFGTSAKLTPWSGNAPALVGSSFEITNCPNSGFDPHLSAGTQNPLAGTYSPFSLRLSREDGSQEIGTLAVTLAPGLIGRPAGLAYCSDPTLAAISGEVGTGAAQAARPSCPAASQVGTVTVAAGAGTEPFFTTSGRAYVAGPYHGAPLSLAVVTPAVAGPFDLGTVVVRNALRIDPTTAQITAVSDPLPSIIHGIPLDLRDVRVNLNRPEFTLNPTNCEPLAIASTITSLQGATASPSERFQVANCDRIGFKPKLALVLKGAVHRRAHPSLSATYTTRPGDANLARAQVKLPPAAFLDNAHIGTVCTRVQFAAGKGGGEGCPSGSIYGTATATSPLLDYPVTGNVYLRSSTHKLPDLVVGLRGPDTQPIEVDLAGKTDSVKGALRNTFEVVPDVPVTRFHLQLFGGKRGLIEMSDGFCSHPNATVKLDGQNGRISETSPTVKAKCGKSGKAKRVKRKW